MMSLLSLLLPDNLVWMSTVTYAGCKHPLTTAYDMYIFLKALIDGSLLSQSLYEQMIAYKEVPELAQNNYGIIGYGMLIF
jgi:hypothetical protein